MLCASQVYAQNRTVTGTVTSKDDGLPLPGVTVKVTGTQIGTQTNGAGKFTLSAPATAKTLDFGFIGYASQTVSIGSGSINVALSASSRQLEEVIVTAGGLASSRKSQGTVVNTVKAEELTAAKPVNVAAGLLGKVPGLQINGTTGGTNPSFRIVLRGMRSLTGNNEALVVLDNVIVPNAVLGNLNPEDVEDIQILNGASGAALYGSDASNGAVIIKTKKGKKGQAEIKAQQSVQIEQVAFYPKLQQTFGGGSDNDLRLFLPYENQQYGPAYDGVVRELGLPLANGAIQMKPYEWTNGKYDFWDTGRTNQTDLSISSGDEKGSMYISGQYADISGTTPKDKFNRANIRFNGMRVMTKNLVANYSITYAQNRYDQTTQTSTIYDQMLEGPGNAPLLDYKDWRNDPYADPSGYYNAYINNPYFTIDNYREKIRNDYLTGSADLKFTPLKWMSLTYRVGFSTRNNSGKSYSDIYKFNDYIKTRPEVGNYKKTDLVGDVTDNSLYTTRITNEFQAAFTHRITDFNFNLVLAGYMRQDRSKSLSATVNGLVQPGLFNLSNSTNPPTASEANYLARQQAVYAVLNIGYKDFLFLNATARNDWDSRLIVKNRSFFYPSVNLSFVPTDAFTALKDIKDIDYIKIRGGFSKVGQVNLGTGNSFGAYRLDATFSQGAGYPYNGVGGFTLNNTIVSNNLTPEFTYSAEAGIDVALFKNRVVAGVTYYSNKTKNQTVTTAVASTTGYTSYLLNAGQTSGKGLETSINFTPVKTKDWDVRVGANFSYYNNRTDELLAGIPNINLGSFTGAGSFAVAGQPFPVLMGRSYVRDPNGRIIVNPVTGYPSGTSTFQQYGNAAPTRIFGTNFTASYKGITLGAVAEYRAGYLIYNAAGTTLDFSGAGYLSAEYNRERFVIPNSSYLQGGVYVPNTNVTVRDGGPAYWTIAGPRRNIDENYITSGAFWKIREITLSYDLPKSLLGKSKFIRAARLSAQGRNLFIFLPKNNVYTDPEYSAGDGNSSGNAVGLTSLGQTPPSRYFGGTLSLTF